ncbi:hypothetical protein ABGB07_07930 [Micromonosporaceae bacterium B7E4]
MVAQLGAVIERLHKEAVEAARTKAEAEQANREFAEVGRGTADRRIRAAITESRTASEKAGKVARLLSEAAAHFSAYINIIAPGAIHDRNLAQDALPDGERLVREAPSREARLARFHKKATQFLADKEGDIKNVEQLSRESISAFKDRIRPGDGQASVGTPSQTTPTQPVSNISQHPITDVLLAVASIALATRASIQKAKAIRERKRRRDSQAGAD